MLEIEKMKQYNEQTSKAGIIMPTIETFDKKISMSINLWPQIGENGEIYYLLGKGVGVEIAIRGEVKGRKKRNNNFPYRSHSDFEIYNCIGYENLPESKPFTFVFGGQELYPKTSTKGLKDMDPGLMDSTYEIVMYNGEEYLVPQLEILFLDKFLCQESTPRNEGCDALLLLKEYELDIDKVLYYFDQYYYNVECEKFIVPSKLYERCLDSLIRGMPAFAKDLLEEDGIEANFENISAKINQLRKGWEKTPNMSYARMPIVCCPSKIEYIINDEGKLDLSKETKEELKRLILQQREKQEDAIVAMREEIIKIFGIVKEEYKYAKKQ